MENATQPLETVAAISTTSKGSVWPFVVYVLALYFVEGFFVASIDRFHSEFLVMVLLSVIIGQIVLAMVVGGLVGSTWLEGVFLSTIAVLWGVGVGLVASGSHIQLEDTLATAMIPLICLVSAFPLILFRWLAGWRLCLQNSVISPRSRLTIEDLILVPASLVAFWVMALAPLGVSQNGESWMSLSMYMIPLLITCAIFVLPCTYWAFRIQDSILRWVLCMGYPIMLTFIAIGVIAGLSRGFPDDGMVWLLFGAMLSSGIAMFGLQLLYFGGYRLVSHKRVTKPATAVESTENQAKVTEPSPFDLEPLVTVTSVAETQQDTIRIRHRVAVAVLLIATAMVNTGTWAYSRGLQNRTLERIVAAGGRVETVNGHPIKIAFGPATTGYEIAQLPSMSTVKSISLEGTNVTSFYLSNNFNSLSSVDIRRTFLKPDKIGLRPSIEIIVSEGQFTDAELQEFKQMRLPVKQVAD